MRFFIFIYRHKAAAHAVSLEVDDGVLGGTLAVLEPEGSASGALEHVDILDSVEQVVVRSLVELGAEWHGLVAWSAVVVGTLVDVSDVIGCVKTREMRLTV